MKMFIVRGSIVIIFVLCFTKSTFSQKYPFTNFDDRIVADVSTQGSLPQVKFIQSPQKVNVNASGNYQLALPLMTVPGRGGLDFNIVMTYTPGIRVTEEASWVGLGWNLDLGSIVRNALGLMDHSVDNEKYLTDPNFTYENPNYSHKAYEQDNTIRDKYNISFPGGSGIIHQFDPTPDNPIEPNPNLPGENYTLQLEEWKPWQIIYESDLSNHIHRFIVTTEDGTKYVFGKAAPGISASSGTNDGNRLVPSIDEPFIKWHLTAILSTDYVDGGGDIYNPLDENILANKGKWIVIKYTFCENKDFMKYYYYDIFSPLQKPISLTSITYPSYIITPNYIAKFETENEADNPISKLNDIGYNGEYTTYDSFFDADDLDKQPHKLKRRLSSIELYKYKVSNENIPSDLGSPMQKITFNYLNPTTEPLTADNNLVYSDYYEKRTMLKSIQIEAGDIQLPPYNFTYHNTMRNTIDRINSSGQKDPFGRDGYADYYGAIYRPDQSYVGFGGWFNSKYLNTESDKDKTLDGNPDDGKMWNLKTITYPNGGSITFDYSSNYYVVDFSYKGSINLQTWGAGTRLINQTIDMGDNTSVFTYSYGSFKNDQTFIAGLGRMYADPLDYYDASLAEPLNWFDKFDPCAITNRTIYPPLVDRCGNHSIFYRTNHQVFYQQITEVQPDGSKIISYYDTPYLNENITTSFPANHTEVFEKTIQHNNGQLLKREIVRTEDGNDIVVKKDEFTSTKEMLNSALNNGPMFSYRNKINVNTTTLDGVVSSDTTEYSSSNGLANKVIETNSDGVQSIAQYKYAHEIPAYIDMKNKNMMVQPYSIEVRKGTDISESKKWTTWDVYNDGKWYPSGEWSWNGNGNTSPDNPEGNSNSITYDVYDDFGNLLQSTDGNGNSKSIIWSYDSSLPVAVINNAKTTKDMIGSQASYIGFETGIASQGTDPNEDYWTLYEGQTSSTDAHTGNVSWKVPVAASSDNPSFGPTRDFRPPDENTQKQTYILSCWVKTEPGFGENKGILVLHSKADSDINDVYPNIDGAIATAYFGDTQGAWKYLEVEVNLAEVRTLGGISLSSLLRLRAFPVNYDLNKYFLVDDIRFQPKNAIIKSFTYNDLNLVSSSSDENNNPIYFDYDSFGRNTITLSPEKKTISENDYPDLTTTNTKIFWNEDKYSCLQSRTDAFNKPVSNALQYGFQSYIASDQVYDNMGRLHYSNKPYYIDEVDDLDNVGYLGGQAPGASENVYYSDPLSRIKEKGIYNSWTWNIGSGHTTRISYRSNNANEVANYLLGTLYTTEITDENGTINMEYRDIFGNVVQKVQNYSESMPDNEKNLTTIFKYDILGKLIQSTPPKGSLYSSNYVYNKLGELIEKTSPDAGTVQYLYDKNGNIRFIRDANHTGGMNNFNITGTASAAANYIDRKILTLPGRIVLTISITNGTSGFKPKLNLRRNGVVVASVTAGIANYSSTASFYLPKGEYTYDIEYLSGSGTADFSIASGESYEFVYNKYDALNRLIETGEYSSIYSSGFTQDNAETEDFPSTSSAMKDKVFIYDNPGTDPLASGQRNLHGKLSYEVSYRLGIITMTTFYSYDEFGRVKWIIQKSAVSGNKKIAYDYDLQGNKLKKSYLNLNNSADNLYTFYEYDLAGRLLNVYTDTDPEGVNKVKEAAYTYYSDGSVQRLELGRHAQGVDYTYNLRGWLTQINHQNLDGLYNGEPQDPGRDGFDSGFPADKFGEVIEYNKLDHIGMAQNAVSQFNGNISWIMYNMKDVNTRGSSIVGWTYEYDQADRLKKADFGYYYGDNWITTDDYDVKSYQYDANGNIISLFRYGNNKNPMDDLLYHYIGNTNKLDYVTDAVGSGTSSVDVDDQAAGNYGYDDNGNTIKDTDGKIGFIQYDITNHPIRTFLTTGQIIDYFYDASGNMVRKYEGINDLHVLGADGQTEAVCRMGGKTRFNNIIAGADIIGRYTAATDVNLTLSNMTLNDKYEAPNSITVEDNVYVEGVAKLKACNSIKLLPGFTCSEGNTFTASIGEVPSTADRFYYLKDHLGSVKMMVDQNGDVKSYDDCYPFGMTMAGRSSVTIEPKYRFTGKEKSEYTGHYLFGARTYNPFIDRWDQVDPMGIKYPALTPYNYCGNSPLIFIDPNGKYTKFISLNGYLVYNQWTIAGALGQLDQENFPIFGYFSLLGRSITNDRSFSPTFDDWIKTGLNMFVDIFSEADCVNNIVMGTNILDTKISYKNAFNLLLDEKTFKNIIDSQVDGYNLAVTVVFDENHHAKVTKDEDQRHIMLNPKLREKWKKEKHWTDKQCDEEFETKFDQKYKEEQEKLIELYSAEE